MMLDVGTSVKIDGGLRVYVISEVLHVSQEYVLSLVPGERGRAATTHRVAMNRVTRITEAEMTSKKVAFPQLGVGDLVLSLDDRIKGVVTHLDGDSVRLGNYSGPELSAGQQPLFCHSAEAPMFRVLARAKDRLSVSETGKDAINPEHYTSGGIECIDYIEAKLGIDGAVAFCQGNVLKYASRAGKKLHMAEDFRKSSWYATKAAELLKKKEDK